jgi:hydroxyacylglutathione hydrolase
VLAFDRFDIRPPEPLGVETAPPSTTAPKIDVHAIRTAGLGDTTYLLTHSGLGVVVDPQRDVERFFEQANTASVRIRYALETHVHNDYVSDGRELARRAQAELGLPAGAGVAFDHTPAFHLEDLQGERLVVRPIHTPGHTPEHLSYLVVVDGQPVALFSGCSLLVGSAGRPDLLGVERAHQLAMAQFHSVQRLGRLPAELGFYPTHGEGSFCAASGGGRTTSTIGLEVRTNPLLQHQTAETFASAQLAGLQPYPKYYACMGGISTLGPEPLPRLAIPELDPPQMKAQPNDVYVLDARSRTAFAWGHVAGALGVELADDLGTWVGWLLLFNAPIVLVLEPDQDLDEAVVQLGRIGFEQVRGRLRGMAAWQGKPPPTCWPGTRRWTPRASCRRSPIAPRGRSSTSARRLNGKPVLCLARCGAMCPICLWTCRWNCGRRSRCGSRAPVAFGPLSPPGYSSTMASARWCWLTEESRTSRAECWSLPPRSPARPPVRSARLGDDTKPRNEVAGGCPGHERPGRSDRRRSSTLIVAGPALMLEAAAHMKPRPARLAPRAHGSTSSTSRPAAVAKTTPRVWVGTVPVCDTGDDASGVCTRSTAGPHLKGVVLCQRGAH